MSVLFVSQLPLGRAENITAVWDAFDGPKEFRMGRESMRTAERDGFSVVVCDCPPAFIEGKSRCKSVNIGHGITGDKLYLADEGDKPWVDREALMQTDYAITASEAGVPTVAGQMLIPKDRVLPLGMPRTDAYFKDFGVQRKATYLYAPTFRDYGRLPEINWWKLECLLTDKERFAVKRHYFTEGRLTPHDLKHVSEFSPDAASAPFLETCTVLLTDYSSIMFDAYILGKPVVLAVDDKKEYLKGRGMYHPYPEFYCSRALSVEGNEVGLVEELRDAARTGMRGIERDCLSTVAGACDGRSTERVVELIRSLL
jgi:CDP-glycerol glycerophosphotransferase (TagB/SpsB family)